MNGIKETNEMKPYWQENLRKEMKGRKKPTCGHDICFWFEGKGFILYYFPYE